MNVLFLTPWYPTENDATWGNFIREHALAAALHAEVTVLHVARVGSGASSARFRRDTRSELTHGLQTFRAGYSGPAGAIGRAAALRYTLHAVRKVRASGFEPDVIHANTFEVAAAAVLAGRESRVPVVLAEHSSKFALNSLSRSWLVASRWAFKRMDRVLPVSEFLKAALIRHGVVGNFHVVPNSFDETKFHPGATRRTAAGGVAQILFVGALSAEDHKGLGDLVTAVATLPDSLRWRLTVAGDGPARTRFEQRVGASQFSDSIEFLGVIPPNEMPALMRQATVLAVPSRMETFGCAAMEAQASGTPVIAYRVGGLPEVVHPPSRLVSLGSVRQLAAGIKEAILTSDAANAAALVRQTQRFARPQVGRELAGLYQSVVAARRVK